jgi:hypothetical protein
MEERYKICLACTSVAIEGCEDMSLEEAQSFLWENDGDEVIETECGDTKKHIMLSVNANPNEQYS